MAMLRKMTTPLRGGISGIPDFNAEEDAKRNKTTARINIINPGIIEAIKTKVLPDNNATIVMVKLTNIS